MPDVSVARDNRLKPFIFFISFGVVILIVLLVVWLTSSDTTTISGQISNQDESSTIDLRLLYYGEDISAGPLDFKDFFDVQTDSTGLFSIPVSDAAVAGASQVRLCVNNQINTPFGEFGDDERDGLAVCKDTANQDAISFDIASCDVYPVSKVNDGFLGAFKSSTSQLIVGSFCDRNLIIVNDDGSVTEDVAETGSQQDLVLKDNILTLGDSSVDLGELELDEDEEATRSGGTGDTFIINNITEETVVEGNDESLPQTLTLSGDSLRISGGNTIDLSKYLDDTDTDTDSFALLSCSVGQVLIDDGAGSWSCTDITALTGETLTSITVAGSVLTYTDENLASVNIDIQDLETTTTLVDNGNGTFTYSNEDGVDVTIVDTDTDDQTLTIAGDTLRLEDGDGADTTVDLAGYLDNTDDQAISASLSGTDLTVSIEDGGSQVVDLSSLGGGTDDQVLALAGNTLTLEDGGTPVDLSPYLDNTDTLTALSCSPNEVAKWNGAAWSCSVDEVNDGDSSSINEIQDISLAGNDLSIDSGSTVDLSGYLDNTDSQDLSLSGNVLSLTNDGTTVSLATYLDNTDSQDLTLTGNTLALTNDGTTVDLSSYLDNTDELAGLSCSPTEIAKWNGAAWACAADDVNDADNNATNELQDISLAGNDLSIDSGSTIDLSGYLDNTDAQDLSLTGNTLALTNDGTTVDLSSYLDNTDELAGLSCSPNEIAKWNGAAWACAADVDTTIADDQTIALAANILTLGNGDGADTTADLSIYLDNTDAQDLALSGNTLSLTNDGTTVDLATYLDNTDNQALSISGNNLELTSDDGTDTVDLSGYLDNTDNQDLSLSGNTLSLTNDGTTVDLSGFLDNTDNQDLSLSGNTLALTNDGTTVDLSSYLDNTDELAGLSCSPTEIAKWNGAAWACAADDVDDADNNATNEIQDLTLTGNTLAVTGDGTTVDLSSYLDNTDTLAGLSCSPNQIAEWNGAAWACLTPVSTNTDNQQISLSGNVLTLSNGTGSDTTANLTPYLDNTDALAVLSCSPNEIAKWNGAAWACNTDEVNDGDSSSINEIQDISLVSNDLSIDSGSTIDLSGYLDNTDSQDLTLAGNILSLTNDGTTVNLSAYLDNTDAQDLALSGNTLSLTNDGTTVDLATYLDNTDNQALSISGNNLELTSDDGTDTVDLSGYLDNTDNQDLSLSGNTLSLTNDGTTVDLSGYLDSLWTDGGTYNYLTSAEDVVIGATTDQGARFAVVGNADETQVEIAAHSTQTSPIILVNDSAGSELFRLSSDASSSINNSLFFGYQAGAADDGTANLGTGVGNGALENNTSGIRNSAFGNSALNANTTGSNNSAFGYGALLNNDAGINNVAVGLFNSASNISGSSNTSLGVNAGNGFGAIVDDSSRNVFVGYRAGYTVDDADNNIIIGYQAGDAITTGNNNIVIGYDVDLAATTSNTLNLGNIIYGTGINQTGFTVDTDAQIGIGDQTPDTGTSTLKLDVEGAVGATEYCDEDGNNCTAAAALGSGANLWTDAGTYNYLTSAEDVVIGATTDQGARFAVVGNADETQVEITANATQTSPIITVNDSGATELFRVHGCSTTDNAEGSLFFGYQAGLNDDCTDNAGIGIGQGALQNNTGYANNAFGRSSLASNTSGSGNTAFGRITLTANVDGDNNTAFGNGSLQSNTSGSLNNAFGNGALRDNTTGVRNVAIGTGALIANTNGSDNIALGFQAGDSLNGGDRNILIGFMAGDSIGAGDNNIVLGYNVDLTSGTNNTLNIGNSLFGLNVDQTGTIVDPDAEIIVGANTSQGGRFAVVGDSRLDDVFIGTALELRDDNNASSIADILFQARGNIAADSHLIFNIDADNDQTDSYFRIRNDAEGTGGSSVFTINENGTVETTGAVLIAGDQDENQLQITAHSTQTSPLIVVNDSVDAELFRIHTCDATSSTNNSLFIGQNAGASDDCSANFNYGIGGDALAAVTSGDSNIAFGRQALSEVITAVDNTAVGDLALQNTTTNSSTGVGANALRYNETGERNVAVGRSAGAGQAANTLNDSTHNTFIGYAAGQLVDDADNNILIGYQAGNAITTGDNNIVIGYNVDLAATSTDMLNIGNIIYGLNVDRTGFNVDTDALIGIGTNTPGYKLEVDGDVFVSEEITADHQIAQPYSSNASYNVWIQGSSIGTASGDARNLALLGTKANDDLILNYNGEYDCVNVGGAVCTHALDVSGGDVNTSAGGYLDAGSCVAGSCASDLNLKNNIQSIDNALEKVNQLNPVSYYFNDPTYGDGLQYGLIAQEVAQVFPELVSTSEKGHLTVSYGLQLQFYTTQAVRELSQKFDGFEETFDGVIEENFDVDNNQSLQLNALAAEITTNTTSITTNTDNIDTLDDAIDIISIDITNINDRLDALEAFDADNFTDIVMDLEERVTALESGSASSSSGTSSHAIDGHIRIDSANDLAFITNITFEEDTTFEQDVAVLGDISFNSDQVGQATIDAGDTSVDIDFTTPYSSLPVVTVTATSDLSGAETYFDFVTDITTSGFTININDALPSDVEFNWQAFPGN